jgi:hypothetical protein
MATTSTIGGNMQTVSDVIEFWKGFCRSEEVERRYGPEAIDRGCEIIAEDADYWSNNSMRKLLDQATA